MGQLEKLTHLVTTTCMHVCTLPAALSEWLMEVLCPRCSVEGPVSQPPEGPASEPGPSQLSAETERVPQRAQLSACQPGPAHK